VTQQTNRRAEGRWKNYARHFERVNVILQPYLKRFGYEE
jgi:hypothetical protein